MEWELAAVGYVEFWSGEVVVLCGGRKVRQVLLVRRMVAVEL